jgi:hypothetical protein
MGLNIVRDIERVQPIHADQQNMFHTLITIAVGVGKSG